MSGPEERLHDALRDEAEGYAYEPVSIGEVEALAGGVRRRQRVRVGASLVAAAAAVVVLAVGVAVVADDGGSGRDGLVGSSSTPAPTAASESVAMPQTLMMPVDRATSMLEDLGLRVEVEVQEGCVPPGRVVSARPDLGARVDPGDTVTVRVSVASQGFCLAPYRFDDVLALLDLARYGTDGPAFAPEVQLWSDGALLRTITADEAADPARWGAGSPLAGLLAELDSVNSTGGAAEPALWSVRDRGADYACGGYPPDPLASRLSTVVQVTRPGSELGTAPGCRWWRIYRDGSERIDVVTSDSSDGSSDQGDVPPPFEVVTEISQVVGSWSPLTLFGRTVDPSRWPGAPTALTFSDPADFQGLSWYSAGDGLNTTSGRYRLGPDGTFSVVRRTVASTLVGCITRCARLANPAAVRDTTALRIDASGHLVLLGDDGRVFGTYERVE